MIRRSSSRRSPRRSRGPAGIRSSAARRGWKTRRARAKARSDAAKRGWETRRKNERKKKRGGGMKPPVPKLQSFLFPFPYKHGTRKPSFVVVATDQAHAEAALESHLEKLSESETSQDGWLHKLTWTKVVILGTAEPGARASVRKRY